MSPRVFIIIPLTVFIISGLFISDTQVWAESCGVNVSDLIMQCLKYVQKLGPLHLPSEGCCAVVKTVDVRCACRFLTEDAVKTISNMISTEKAVSVARSCGLQLSPGTQCGTPKIQLSPGTQCGSFTIPP